MRSWLVFIVIVMGLASWLGTPHLLVATACPMYGGACVDHDPACLYVGVQGYRGERQSGADRCQAVRMMPLKSPLFQWQDRG